MLLLLVGMPIELRRKLFAFDPVQKHPRRASQGKWESPEPITSCFVRKMRCSCLYKGPGSFFVCGYIVHTLWQHNYYSMYIDM